MGVEILKYTDSHLLSGSAMNLSFSPSDLKDFKLAQVMVAFGAGVTETVTVNRDSADGANYDTQLATSDLTAATSYVFRPTGECIFKKGDAVNVTCTNATATTTAYVTALLEDKNAS